MPNFRHKQWLYSRIKGKRFSSFETKLVSKLLFHHQKEEIKPEINFNIYWAEAEKLKRKYGILNGECFAKKVRKENI